MAFINKNQKKLLAAFLRLKHLNKKQGHEGQKEGYMKVKVKCEALGSIVSTPKGYIRQFLVVDHVGEKGVIKVFSKNEADLAQQGPHDRIVETDDFCFAPKG